jgi:tripartite-type tricarboxylate transporter receptor subunit TctC
MESFNSMTGLKLTHVPYKQTSAALADLLSGQIHIYCPAAPSLPAFLQSGKVRALGVTYQKPTALVPGVPPVADTVPGFELLGWYGMQAQLRTPPDLVARLNADLVKALKSPDLQERLFTVGAEAGGTTPREFDTFLKAQTLRWEKLLREHGVIPGKG